MIIIALLKVEPNVNYNGHSRDTCVLKGSPIKKFSYITFLFVTSIEGTSLFKGKEHLFWVPKPGFKLHSSDTLNQHPKAN